MEKYKYDVAFSLCKEDVEFARKLIQALNPSLKVFFYEDRQEELINKNGAEKFAKVFKEEARVVVILHRESWGETFYTEIEENAITDRNKKGYGFLFVIPLEKGKAPAWYPTSKIYASPFNFKIEDLARFIEFKVTELNGVVKPVLFEDRIVHFKEQLKKKSEIRQFLQLKESVDSSEKEVKRLIDLFNGKIDSTLAAGLPVPNSHFKFPPTFNPQGHGEFGLGQNILRMYISMDSQFGPVTSSQCFQVKFLTFVDPTGRIEPNNENIKAIMNYRFNADMALLNGWSQEKIFEIENLTNEKFPEYLLRRPGRGPYYQLDNIITSENLIEQWFTKLYRMVNEEFKVLLR